VSRKTVSDVTALGLALFYIDDGDVSCFPGGLASHHWVKGRLGPLADSAA
jgi:hypothetical protein